MREFAPFHEEHWFEIYGRVALTGEPIRFSNESKQFNRWFDVYANRFGKPEDREVAILFCDITDRKRTEMRLVESEERFHTLADNISQLAWMADTQGDIFWYNKRWYEFTGINYEIMRKEGVKKVIHTDHHDHVMSSFQKAIKSGDPWEHSFLMRRGDGIYCWFLTRAMPIRNEYGKIIRWFGTNTDITEIRNLQEEVKRELLRTIFDTIPVMLVIQDPVELKFEVNNFFENITGWSNDELKVSDPLDKLFSDPQYREKIINSFQLLEPGYRDFIITGKNGENIDSSWANVKLPDGRQVGIGIDIRERKIIEEELRIAEGRFHKITSNEIIGVIISNLQSSIYFVSDYFLNIIGYSREEFSNGISLKEITPQEYRLVDTKAIEELRLTGATVPYEKEFIRKDGVRVWVLMAATMLPGPEQKTFAFILDITDRKQALNEALRRKAETEAILNSLPDGYIIYDPDGSIRQMNERARSVYGYTDNEIKLSFASRMHISNYLTPDGKSLPQCADKL